MADLSARYPADRYLLPLQKRLRYRDAGGSLDVLAIKAAARLLPFAGGLDEPHRARLAKMIGRLEKAVIVVGSSVEPQTIGEQNAPVNMDESYGFPIVIEVPEGGQRSGISADGSPWVSAMTGAGYGFLPGTLAADSDEVDVYRGPLSAPEAPICFVVAQVIDEERKLMVGFACAADAIRCYLANMPIQYFGEIFAVPLALIGELMGYEQGTPGIVKKALEVGTARAGAATLITKAGMMIAGFSRVEIEPTDDPMGRAFARQGWTMRDGVAVQKGADDATTRSFLRDITAIEKNVALPGKGSPRSWKANLHDAVRCAVEPLQKAAAVRLAKALEGAASYTGAAPALASRAELADHPALTAPFSGTYDNPEDVGGWQGWIEDDAETWIAFVDTAGKALLWTKRDPDGGVIGDPVSFDRPDLVKPAPGSVMDDASATKTAVKLPIRILPITKGLDASTPREKRIVIGVVLEPEPFDGQGDAHDETYSAEEIERAAHTYCASYRNLNDSHGRFISSDRAVVIQCYVAPQELLIGGTVIKPGSWMLAAKIFDDVLWGRVLTGELGAWSIEGYAERTPNVGPALQPTMPA